MLSFISGLCSVFGRQHGFAPNVVYVNSQHYDSLVNELAGLSGHAALREKLGMEIIVGEDVMHPRVGWISSAARHEDSFAQAS